MYRVKQTKFVFITSLSETTHRQANETPKNSIWIRSSLDAAGTRRERWGPADAKDENPLSDVPGSDEYPLTIKRLAQQNAQRTQRHWLVLLANSSKESFAL
jgi:hypothetical protein